MHVDHACAVKKKGSSKVCGWICSDWPSWFWESQHTSTGNLWSLGHSCRSSFHHWSPEHQELRDLNWSAQPSPCCHDNVFLSVLPWAPWDKLRANLPHLQFLANNCVYSSHTDIKLCTYCLYRHTTVIIHEILYLADQLWCIDFLTPPTPLIITHRLPWISCATQKLMLDSCKMVQRQSEAFHTFLWHFFQVENRILLHIILLKCPHVQIAFLKFTSCDNQALRSRVYSNCCCSCWFEPEIIKIGQSSHKMYSNKILNFQESTTILNACTKNSRNLLKAPRTLYYMVQSVTQGFMQSGIVGLREDLKKRLIWLFLWGLFVCVPKIMCFWMLLWSSTISFSLDHSSLLILSSFVPLLPTNRQRSYV